MIELSPAAQAVVNGAIELDYGAPTPVLFRRLAAALRAAADQVLAATWKGQIQPDATHMIGINWSRDALYAIANELEGQ